MRILPTLAFSLAGWVASGPLPAGAPPDWRATGPWGGPVSALEVPDPDGNRAYALTYGGLYRSDDHGANWTLTPSPNPSVRYHTQTRIAVSRADSERVVLVHATQAFLSSDGGQTWAELELAAAAAAGQSVSIVDSVAVHPHDPDRVAVFLRVFDPQLGPHPVVWISADAGATFVASSVPPLPQCGVASSGSVFAATYAGEQLVYLHHEICPGGAQARARIWEGMNLATVGSIADGEVLVVDQQLYARSGTLVTSAAIVGGAASILRNDSRRLQGMADGSLVSGAREGLFRSANGGQAWTRISNASFGLAGSEARYSGVAARFADPERWIAGNEDGLFVSVNSGDTWAFSSQGLSGFNLRVVAVDPLRPQRYWVGVGEHWGGYDPSQQVLYRTSDDGGSWQISNLASMAMRLRDIVIDPDTVSDADGTHLYASGLGCPIAQLCPGFPTLGHGLYRSLNGGETWTPMAPMVPGVSTFNNHRDLVLVTDAGTIGARKLLVTSSKPALGLVATTTDSGASWGITSAGLPTSQQGNSLSDALDLALAPSNPNRVYLATTTSAAAGQKPTDPSGVFVSNDGGQSWGHRSVGLPSFSPVNAEPGTVKVASHPLDADIAWTVTNEFDAAENSLHSRVFRTMDGGATWQEASTGLPFDRHTALAADPLQPGQVYLGSASGVFWSHDSGASWQRLGSPLPGTVQSIAVGPTDIYVAGLRGVHRIARPIRGDPIFCSGFDPTLGRRPLSAECSGRLSGAQ
jgi:photosystem II stability/assembly factor-like uncharacterized protein